MTSPTTCATLRRRLGEATATCKIDEHGPGWPSSRPRSAAPDLWDDQERAKKLNTEYANVKDDLDHVRRACAGELDDAEVLHELAREVDDESQEPEIDATRSRRSAQQLDQLDLRSLFTGEHDEADASCQINAKDGGVDAQDWAEMLLRMYEPLGRATRLRHRGRRRLARAPRPASCRPSSRSPGRYAYGLMTAERGTHRLVRISPFDNQGRRQTSFAAVQVWPVMDDADVEINDADIRMEVFRASGAGGQHVNKTSSAVRLIHEPTGLVATLAGGAQPAAEPGAGDGPPAGDGRGEDRGGARRPSWTRSPGKQAQVGWGSQIRSYVLQPYQMVKDLRTDVEIGQRRRRARRRHRRVHGGLPALAAAAPATKRDRRAAVATSRPVTPFAPTTVGTVEAPMRGPACGRRAPSERPMIRLENVTKIYYGRGRRPARRLVRRRQGRVRVPRRPVRLGQVDAAAPA